MALGRRPAIGLWSCPPDPTDAIPAKEDRMALVSLAQRGNFMHVYDFRVLPGRGEDFIRAFDTFDYSDDNPMHKTPAQAKDGVLCRDVNDPDHFYLLGEWKD